MRNENADQDDEAEALVPSTDEEEQDDYEEVLHNAQEDGEIINARCYSAFDDANVGDDARLFYMMTGESPEVKDNPVQ